MQLNFLHTPNREIALEAIHRAEEGSLEVPSFETETLPALGDEYSKLREIGTLDDLVAWSKGAGSLHDTSRGRILRAARHAAATYNGCLVKILEQCPKMLPASYPHLDLSHYRQHSLLAGTCHPIGGVDREQEALLHDLILKHPDALVLVEQGVACHLGLPLGDATYDMGKRKFVPLRSRPAGSSDKRYRIAEIPDFICYKLTDAISDSWRQVATVPGTLVEAFQRGMSRRTGVESAAQISDARFLNLPYERIGSWSMGDITGETLPTHLAVQIGAARGGVGCVLKRSAFIAELLPLIEPERLKIVILGNVHVYEVAFFSANPEVAAPMRDLASRTANHWDTPRWDTIRRRATFQKGLNLLLALGTPTLSALTAIGMWLGR